MSQETITKSDLRLVLKGIECPSEYKYSISNEFDNGYFEPLVKQIIDKGLATDLESAVRFFIKYDMENRSTHNQKVHNSDIEKTSSNLQLYKKVDDALGQKKSPKKKDISREFGVRGHVTIPNLFSGKFIKLEKRKGLEKPIVQQGDLNFGGEILFPSNTESVSHMTSQERTTLSHIKSIQILWRKIVNRLGNDMFPAHTKDYEELVKLMLSVFGDDLKLIFGLAKRNEEYEYLGFLTVLTWVTAILRYRDIGTTVLFKEVRLFPDYYDVSLGRIDALEVVLIGEEPPNSQQIKILERLANNRYDSIGHLIYVLVQTFRKKLKLKIHDWKFSVGDGDNGIGKTLNIVHFKEIQLQPLPKHLSQMERYLSTTMISYATIASSYSKKTEEFWQNEAFDVSGEIHYFFPDRIWMTHTVDLTHEEKKNSFSKIANGYKDAEFRRKFLNVSRSFLHLGLKLMRGDGHKANSKQLIFPELSQQSQSADGHVHKTGKISSVLKDSVERVFLDEFGIIEHFGKSKNGWDKNGVHLDKILDGIDAGKLFADPDPRRNGRGAIRCPIHNERTASFHISIPKRIGKCFGCGAGGKIIESSIPASINAPMLVSNRVLNKETRRMTSLVVPERHKEIMIMAQRILQRGFFDSPAARYLEEKRKLNAEIAHYRRGAGYGSLSLISGLLEEGFTYDELIHFGFLGITEKIKSVTPLVSLLESRGIPFSEIQKVTPSVKSGEPDVVGLPFSFLEGKLTYPLEIGGTINNFYGRSLDPECPKKYRHIKLSSEHTNIPHGGFNMYESLRRELHKAHPILIIDEAPLNVETFIQISTDNPSVIGLVGVNNDLLFELLADFPGDLLWALNNDDPEFDKNGEQLFDQYGNPKGMTGQRNTIKAAMKVRAFGFRGNNLVFTKPFARSYPNLKYNDLNQFWTEYGQSRGELIRALSYIESISELPDPNWTPEEQKAFWLRNYPLVKT